MRRRSQSFIQRRWKTCPQGNHFRFLVSSSLPWFSVEVPAPLGRSGARQIGQSPSAFCFFTFLFLVDCFAIVRLTGGIVRREPAVLVIDLKASGCCVCDCVRWPRRTSSKLGCARVLLDSVLASVLLVGSAANAPVSRDRSVWPIASCCRCKICSLSCSLCRSLSRCRCCTCRSSSRNCCRSCSNNWRPRSNCICR